MPGAQSVLMLSNPHDLLMRMTLKPVHDGDLYSADRGSWVYEIESTTVNATGTTVKFGKGGQQEARGTGSPTAGGGTFYLSHRKVPNHRHVCDLCGLGFDFSRQHALHRHRRQ